MKGMRIVEQFDTMTQVFIFQDQAKKIYGRLQRKYAFDYVFIDTEEGLKYKVIIKLYE